MIALLERPEPRAARRRHDTLEARSRHGILYTRLPACEVCSAPQYEKAVAPIVFVASHPRWQAL
jgi:hypothetical protein